MPTIVLNKKRFMDLVGKELDDSILADRISMLGTDLDKIEGNEIHVEVFPNRPDMLSEQGFARALSSFIGIKTGLRNYKVHKAEASYKVIVDSSVADVRPYTACAIVKGLNLDDERIREIIQIQEKLHVTYGRNRKKAAIGIYPLEKIKLPITFFAESPEKVSFQPLDSEKEMKSMEILKSHPTGKAYGHLLEGCKKFPFFKDSENKILSMPPIINSHETGRITESTKEVFIECSGFDFNTLSICLNIIVTALADMGGKIYEMKLVYKDSVKQTPDLKPRKMRLDIDYANKLLGIKLSENKIKELLEKMGYGYEDNNAFIPAYRADILHQIDIVEDIAIAYGYENFEPEIPNISTIGSADIFEAFKKKCADIMVGFSLLEASSFHLSSLEEHNKKMLYSPEVIELENSLSEDYAILRSWLVPGLVKIISENKHHDYPQNIFEIGQVFLPDSSTETNVAEEARLAVCLASKSADFTKAKQILEGFIMALGIKSFSYEEKDHASFIAGRSAALLIENKELAIVGELKPEVIDNFGIELPLAVFEIKLDSLYSIIKS